MTTFKHKTLPIEIGYSEYIKLSEIEKMDFVIVNTQAENQSNTTINNNTSDVLGFGEVAATVVVVPAVIVGAFLGFFD